MHYLLHGRFLIYFKCVSPSMYLIRIIALSGKLQGYATRTFHCYKHARLFLEKTLSSMITGL